MHLNAQYKSVKDFVQKCGEIRNTYEYKTNMVNTNAWQYLVWWLLIGC